MKLSKLKTVETTIVETIELTPKDIIELLVNAKVIEAPTARVRVEISADFTGEMVDGDVLIVHLTETTQTCI